MGIRIGGVVAGLALGVVGMAPPTQAQSLGVFRWQTQPFCNVVTVAVTQVGGVYRLEGTDDQCGAATQASVIGTAFLNANGTIGLGFTIVATPGGAPLMVDATVSLPAVQGTWRDSAGRTGTFMPTPGAGTGGSPRPPAGLGAAAVDTTQIQRRIATGCPAGQAVRTVNQDGTVDCQSTSGGGGTITGVTAGTGLTGGGTGGNVTLGVAPGGIGTTQIADGSIGASDIDPAQVQRRIAATCGTGLFAVGVGQDGTLTCSKGITVAFNNTALGGVNFQALTSGSSNTAVGTFALRDLTVGESNTAVGDGVLRANVSGSRNTALGYQSLFVATGSDNIAIGWSAGLNLGGGSNNIFVGNGGVVTDSDTIRFGNNQTRAFVAGIRGRTTGVPDAINVLIDSNGQLGTVSSSRRFKQDIAPMGDRTRGLHDLRPVTFRYISHAEAGSTTLEYGLIAEEVADIYPDLVVRNAEGEIETVQYHKLTPMLLNEVQRLERERAALEHRLDEQARELSALRERLDRLLTHP